MDLEAADQLRLEFLGRLKEVEERLATDRLEEVDELLLAGHQLLKERKSVVASVLHLASGLQEYRRKEIRHRVDRLSNSPCKIAERFLQRLM